MEDWRCCEQCNRCDHRQPGGVCSWKAGMVDNRRPCQLPQGRELLDLLEADRLQGRRVHLRWWRMCLDGAALRPTKWLQVSASYPSYDFSFAWELPTKNIYSLVAWPVPSSVMNPMRTGVSFCCWRQATTKWFLLSSGKFCLFLGYCLFPGRQIEQWSPQQ